jgi:magnesium-transporting ATPase (P-type)
VKTDKDKYLLFCKGADSEIEKRAEKCNDRNKNCCMQIKSQVKKYSFEGLRTLILAMREISA